MCCLPDNGCASLGLEDAGTVTVLFGSADGLTESGAQTLVQGSGGIAGTTE